MLPPAEMVHWLFGIGIGFVGLCLLSQAIVGREVWEVRRWRKYLWPGLAFTLGVLLWPVMAFFTNSAIHMYAHGTWAEVLMLAGGSELALVRGRLKSPYWRLTWPLAFVVSSIAFKANNGSMKITGGQLGASRKANKQVMDLPLDASMLDGLLDSEARVAGPVSDEARILLGGRHSQVLAIATAILVLLLDTDA